MWNSYSFQPIGPWIGYSFTDLGAEGCCRSLKALLGFWRFSQLLWLLSETGEWPVGPYGKVLTRYMTYTNHGSCITALTPKHLENHRYIFCTMATDALILKQQVVNVRSADAILIILGQFHIHILHLLRKNIRKWDCILKEKILSCLRVRHRRTCLRTIALVSTPKTVHSRPEQNGRHLTYGIFKYIFTKETFDISIQISLKFVPKGTIENKAAMVLIMACCWTADGSLPEAVLIKLYDIIWLL